SENEKAIDISSLRASTGYITLDTGYKNTGSTTSSITFLDGEKGILSYRGYPIEQLAEKSSFIEVAYLLIYGQLPTQEQINTFSDRFNRHTNLNEDFKKIFDGFPSTSHPMGVLSSLVSSLTAYYPRSINPSNASDEQVDLTIIRLLAKLPTN